MDPDQVGTRHLVAIRNQYFALYPPSLIALSPSDTPSLWLAQNQSWLYKHLLSETSLALEYPPAADYQKKFWKKLMTELEHQLGSDEAVELELVSVVVMSGTLSDTYLWII